MVLRTSWTEAATCSAVALANWDIDVEMSRLAASICCPDVLEESSRREKVASCISLTMPSWERRMSQAIPPKQTMRSVAMGVTEV
jgi:hypothetical protein